MTERRLLQGKKDSLPTIRININRPKCFVTQSLNKQTTIYVPIYISTSLKELVNVNLETSTVQASFLIYISIFLDIEEQFFYMIQSEQIFKVSQLKEFIANNLKLQIGNKTVDIFYHGKNKPVQQILEEEIVKEVIHKRPTLKQVTSSVQRQSYFVSLQSFEQQQWQYKPIDESDDDQDVYQEQYYTKKMPSSNSKVANHFVSGIFQCSFALDSSFFPYHEIKSNLKISLNRQYYRNIKIKYNMIFPQNHLENLQQFNFVFPQISYAKFGIYTVNFNYRDVTSKVSQDIHYGLEKNLAISYRHKRNLEFNIFSYNIPFILRNYIPVWILCFASLMLFYANDDDTSSIYGNIILLYVSFIFLLMNFRRSKYYANTLSLYESTVFCYIVGDSLFLIDSTNNFYRSGKVDVNEPSQIELFHVYAGITLLGVFLTVIFMIILGILTLQRKFKLPDKSGHILNHTWIEQFLVESQNVESSYVPPPSNSLVEI